MTPSPAADMRTRPWRDRSRASAGAAAPRPTALVITQFYPPEPCAAANRVAALVAALATAGFDVRVVTAVASFPSGRVAAADRVRFARTAQAGAVRLTRVATFASPVLTGRHRLYNWLSVAFAAAAYVAALRARPDVVIVTSPPITLALPALVARLRHRCALVVDVRDVYPDVAVEMGYWRADGAAARVVGALARLLYRAADLVLCVTDGARDALVARGCPSARIALVPNGFDAPQAAARSPYARVDGEFVAAFAGNMGLATGLDAILDAAARLRDEPNVRFVLAGDGADRARLAARARAEGLRNVVFLGAVPRDEANALLGDAGVAVVPLHPGLRESVPTKLFDALALGCPIVCAADGEARAFVERSGGGVVVPPGDGRALADAVLRLRDEPQARARCAESGRAYVAAHHDRATIMRAAAERVRALVAARASSVNAGS